MSRVRISGPVVDLPVGDARAEASGENLPLGYEIEGADFRAVLVRVNAAAGAVHGAFCFIDPESATAFEAVPADDTNAAALDAQNRPVARCGFLQTDTDATAAAAESADDNDVAWLVTKSTNQAAAAGTGLSINDGGNAIAADSQVTTTAAAGTINDAAGVGTFDISGVVVQSATPGDTSGIIETGVTWDEPRLAATAN